MKTIALAVAATIAASSALAQATPPAPASPAAPPAGTADSQTAPASPRDGRPGRGAFIKMQSPGGAEISVRCADGDTTRACADVVLQLLERTRGMGSERRREWSDHHEGRDDGRYGDWRRERNRD